MLLIRTYDTLKSVSHILYEKHDILDCGSVGALLILGRTGSPNSVARQDLLLASGEITVEQENGCVPFLFFSRCRVMVVDILDLIFQPMFCLFRSAL